MKRLLAGLAALGSLVAIDGAHAAGPPPRIEAAPATFTLSSKACPLLPRGSTLRGRGTMRTSTTTRTDAQGVTRVVVSARAHGRATDNAKRSYVFDYSNTMRVSKPAQGQTLYTGVMYDLFTLAGNGPASLDNGFVAVATTDLGMFFRLEPITSFGNPISFATGTPHCDPL